MGVGGSRAGFSDVYHAFNMLSPWMVGAIGDVNGSDWMYQNINVPDQADCNAHGIDYQPCVLPGDVSRRERAHGDFMWRQVYNMVRVAQGIYISMFDEYNEGSQIAKTAENASMFPAGSGLLALDEDGTACSSDYYLRLTADGGRMLKGQIPLTANRPAQPVVTSGGGTSTMISLRARVNGMYVAAENAGRPLIANRTRSRRREQFDLIDTGGGAVALRAHANGTYVTAESGGTQPLITSHGGRRDHTRRPPRDEEPDPAKPVGVAQHASDERVRG